MTDTYRSSGTNPYVDPFKVHECICDNPKLIPSSLPNRIYTCVQCGGKMTINGAIRHLGGVIFALQAEITAHKNFVEDQDFS